MQAACDTCHRRKSRCDKIKPTCGFCEKSKMECIYTDRSKEPTFRKEHVEAVERRLRQAEAKNKALLSDLAKYRSGVVSGRVQTDVMSPDAVQYSSADKDSLSGDVINEVSFLASTAAGERHYLGSTSGVLFANLVRASVDVTTASHQINSTTLVPSLSNTLSKPLSIANVKDALPSKELAKELVDNYLAHDHLCYPFLLPSAILSIVESIYQDPSFYAKSSFQAFVFDMILAIATANVYKFDWQMLPSAETHHARAMLRINEVFQAGGIQSLQAILLLCQYRTSSSMRDTSASMWHLVGIAARIAYELGLHREAAYLMKRQSLHDADDLDEMKDMEIRRRCFWSVFALDRIVGITLGRPMALDMDEVDVQLPLIDNDHITNSYLETETNSSVNRTSIFVHIIRYRLLCGRIMRTLHGLKRSDQQENEMRRLRDELALDLSKWQTQTRELDLPDVDLTSTMSQDRSSFRSKEWYELLYNNAMLMLFRPSPRLSDISGDSAALLKLFWSSKQAVILYAYLHRSRKINYSWITLHSVFMAGLTYLYVLSRRFRERRRQSPTGAMLESDPSPIEIVNDTRACSNVLVAVSERCNALRNCHEVFDRLSDAVLADAIKLQSSSPRCLQLTPIPQEPLETRESPVTGPAAMQLQANISYSTQPHGGETSNELYGSWPRNGHSMTSTPGFYANASPLAVDSEFRNCFNDLQHLYNEPYVSDPVMQLSQDWLGYIDGFGGVISPVPLGQ